MRNTIKIIFISLITLQSQLAFSEDLLVTKKSWDQSRFSYPTIGEAEMTAVRITLKENEQTPDHCHPVPVFGYMLRGQIEVKTNNGKSAIFTAGDAIAEVMNKIHNGKAIGGDAELIVFYAGSTSMPNTILSNDEKYKIYCPY